MAAREAIQRWQSVLLDIDQYDALPSGQRVRAQLSTAQARANVAVVNASPLYGVARGMLTTPFTDLWSVDPPTDPALVAVLEPVRNAAMALTPYAELLPQWDRYVAAARAARLALDTEQMGEPTVGEVAAEMMLSLKTSLLMAGTGRLGAMTVIATELVRRHASFATPITLPLRHYDFATNAMVDHPSRTTLSIAAIKAIVNPVRETSDDDSSQLPVMKQFAAQVIVDFYTDWEDYYRGVLADAHQCSKYDFQIDYFGDLGKMRHDYVHNRGVCSNSAHCDTLRWFSKGDLMIPTSANYLQLLTDFPADELGHKPPRADSGRAPVKGSANIPVLREFEKIARDLHGGVGPALDEALAAWTDKNKRAD